MLIGNKGSLVDIVNEVKRKEPIFITAEVDEFLPSCSGLDYSKFIRFDIGTRGMEGEHLGTGALKEVYARRLLAGIYFSQEVSHRSEAYRDTIFAYDKAGRAAKLLSNSTGDDAKFWILRSALTRLLSGRFSETGGFCKDAFFSYLFVAESALRLLDQNSLDIPDFTYERIFDIFTNAFDKMDHFLNDRFLAEPKVYETYRRVASGHEKFVWQSRRLHA